MNPDGRRNTCQKPEERMGREEEWDGTLFGEGEDEEEGEEGGKVTRTLSTALNRTRKLTRTRIRTLTLT